ncbi:hypothetical protein SUGI_0593980 [Cryptomeria japonica]|nr:hypothetical protein SUGI_0593980 [Cryptomeria japonica]
MQQRRMSAETTKKNEKEWSNARLDDYAALNNKQKIDFKMVEVKFWRPKPSVEAAKVLEVCPNSVYSRVLNIEISNEDWCENIRFLNEHALFLKWGAHGHLFQRSEHGLPHEYKDIETLRRIGETLGIFRKVEEFIDFVNFSMVSRICIDWNLVHNILDTLEIKTGSSIWIQKVVLEDLMESCPECKSFGHPKGDCKIGDKGKLKEQNVLAEEIIRLSESKDWEHQWEALD